MNTELNAIEIIESEIYEMVTNEKIFENEFNPTTKWTNLFKRFFLDKINFNNKLIYIFNPGKRNEYGHLFPDQENLIIKEFSLDINAIQKTNLEFCLGVEIEWSKNKKIPKNEPFFDREFLEKLFNLKFTDDVDKKVIDCLFDFSKLIIINPKFKIMFCAPYEDAKEQSILLDYMNLIIESRPNLDNVLVVFLSKVPEKTQLYFKTYMLKVDNGRSKLIMKRCELIN